MRAALAIVLIGASYVGAQAPPGSVEGRARDAFDAWVSALNTGQAQTVMAFDAARRAVPVPIMESMFLRATTGGFTLVRIERDDPRSVTALVQEQFSEQLHRV